MRVHSRGALGTLVGSVIALAAVAVGPSAASASEVTGGYGYIEICKTFTAGPTGAPMYQGHFTFKISDGSLQTSVSINALQGGPQVCTAPIPVPAGTATVTEVGAPWFHVSSITATPGDPGTVTPSTMFPGTATLSVKPAPSPGNQSLTTTVQYTDDPVTGTLEVCKQPAANSSALTGAYNFNITSEESGISVYDAATGAYDLPWTTTASATISSAGLGCSGPIVVPAGTVQTVEPGTTYVTAISATANGWNQLDGPPNLGLATSYEEVWPGDTTNQTVVTYTDAMSTVKLCKAWAGPGAPNTAFPFALTSSGPGGPTAVTSSANLTVGSCQIVGSVRAGTQVNITEGVVPGTKVDAIMVSPKLNAQGVSPIVDSSLSLPNRTVSVTAGAGETDVTFLDGPADPGTLKICVAPTANAANGTVPFTVNGSQTINVNLSNNAVQCTIDPTPFAFNSAVTIKGGALPASDDFYGTPSVVPKNVEVLAWPFPMVTNQPSLSASTASSATVLMSEGMITEVTFNIDPPAPATAPTQTETPSAAAVAADSTPSAAADGLLGAVSGTSAPILSSGPAVTGSSVKSGAVTKNRAKVARVEKQIAKVRSQIRTLNKRLASKHLRSAVRRADRRQLAKLRVTERKLMRELKGLKLL